jgi:hypothetical protein
MVKTCSTQKTYKKYTQQFRLVHDVNINLSHAVSRGTMKVNYELERIWKKAFLVYVTVTFRFLRDAEIREDSGPPDKERKLEIPEQEAVLPISRRKVLFIST